jgi:hypothetical protein
MYVYIVIINALVEEHTDHQNSIFFFHHFSGLELHYLAHTAIYWLRHASA